MSNITVKKEDSLGGKFLGGGHSYGPAPYSGVEIGDQDIRGPKEAGEPWPDLGSYTVTQKAGTAEDSIPA